MAVKRGGQKAEQLLWFKGCSRESLNQGGGGGGALSQDEFWPRTDTNLT